jgi:signal peptidase I
MISSVDCRARTTVETVVRAQLLLLPLPALALLAAALQRGGYWIAAVVPAALVLALHARVLAQVGLRTWTGVLGNLALVFGCATFAVLAVGPTFGFYRTITVLSGSMQPTFRAGDVIVVTPQPASQLRVGEAITFQIPVGDRQVETHRVVRILEHGREPVVQTKGDANQSTDPWTAKLHGGTLWRYRFRIPLLGFPLLALRAPMMHRLLVYILPGLLALYLIGRLWLPRKTPLLDHAPSEI